MYHRLNAACLLLTLVCSCQPRQRPENPDAWKKIHLDFKKLDAEGLSGPEGGKVALNYEFCIPDGEKYWKAVRRTDPSAQRQKAGKGRVGCTDQQWLIIGSTHQKNYQRVLFELASMPYIMSIEEVFWE